MMKSPLPVLAITFLYLYFVLKQGPEFMTNRKPFVLKHLLIGYNFSQVVFCAWLFFKSGVSYLLKKPYVKTKKKEKFQTFGPKVIASVVGFGCKSIKEQDQAMFVLVSQVMIDKGDCNSFFFLTRFQKYIGGTLFPKLLIYLTQYFLS